MKQKTILCSLALLLLANSAFSTQVTAEPIAKPPARQHTMAQDNEPVTEEDCVALSRAHATLLNGFHIRAHADYSNVSFQACDAESDAKGYQTGHYTQ